MEQEQLMVEKENLEKVYPAGERQLNLDALLKKIIQKIFQILQV